MWNRLKNSTTGFNWDFISNIFRRRSYTKFDSDSNDQPSSDLRYCPDNLRDEENNELCWNEECYLASPSNESGYGSICTTPQNDNDHVYIDQYGHYDSTDSSNPVICGDKFSHKTPRSFGIYGKDRPTTSSSDYASTSDRSFRAVSYKVRGEVKDVVNSYVQRKYTKLEDDADDISDDIEEIDFHESEDIDNSNVFHSAKEIHPECSDKPKRLTKKKIAKRTRRVIRTSWKWVKRGFVGYARSFNAPNLFILVSPDAFRQRM